MHVITPPAVDVRALYCGQWPVLHVSIATSGRVDREAFNLSLHRSLETRCCVPFVTQSLTHHTLFGIRGLSFHSRRKPRLLAISQSLRDSTLRFLCACVRVDCSPYLDPTRMLAPLVLTLQHLAVSRNNFLRWFHCHYGAGVFISRSLRPCSIFFPFFSYRSFRKARANNSLSM